MIACIDVGLKRIGIALGYKNGVIVPINAVLRQNRNQAAKDVKHILDEWNVKHLVVGSPLGGNSDEALRSRISHFVNLLDFNGEIVFFDESFSSVEAGEFGVANHKKKDGKLDSLSAMVILQRYFDSLK